MKKDGRRLSIDIHQNNYDKLEKQAKLNNQTITKYIESVINKKEKFNPKILQAINKSNDILNTHITTYKALNAAISNLNQLLYFLNIGEIPTKDEIISALNLTKTCTLKNKESVKTIIKEFTHFTNNKKLKAVNKVTNKESTL